MAYLFFINTKTSQAYLQILQTLGGINKKLKIINKLHKILSCGLSHPILKNNGKSKTHLFCVYRSSVRMKHRHPYAWVKSIPDYPNDEFGANPIQIRERMK